MNSKSIVVEYPKRSMMNDLRKRAREAGSGEWINRGDKETKSAIREKNSEEFIYDKKKSRKDEK